ncbi:hypothetical protein [Micromonospora sp. HUAS LYJ1]|uniref:hypothetical protein n=1 Tax=Micromonospora sp. HUAS LYJ1 TaxID=3061626 RepID=UPI002670E279|nr:hypothetical protein [Micromonospora sp. HUAS LYJ1]WKU03861.1 hypothetical protein Q2K16_23925 [Micromonospora sp. HUAS LYJ1]
MLRELQGRTAPSTVGQLVAATVAAAPPLTVEQRHRLAALLRPVTAEQVPVVGRRPELATRAAA